MDKEEFFEYIWAKINVDISEKRIVDIQEVFDEAIYVFFGDYEKKEGVN